MSITNVLYSRSEFLENVNDFLESHALSDWCIISIDIERFKLFNNWYGQEAGDILLTNISQYLLRIQQMKGYLAGYFGGDHFFMCIPDDDQLINLIIKRSGAISASTARTRDFCLSLASILSLMIIRMLQRCATMHSSQVLI